MSIESMLARCGLSAAQIKEQTKAQRPPPKFSPPPPPPKPKKKAKLPNGWTSLFQGRRLLAHHHCQICHCTVSRHATFCRIHAPHPRRGRKLIR